MSEITLIFPHQLFENHPAIHHKRPVILIEEFLFFNQYKFHKQKIAFHRASMKFYLDYLNSKKIETSYIDASDDLSDIRKLILNLKKQGITKLHYVSPVDNWLEKRLKKTSEKHKIAREEYRSPMFLNSVTDLKKFFAGNTNLLQTKFYIEQRKKLNILIDSNGKPEGGKWTFDSENRKKYPKDKTPPNIKFPDKNKFYNEALKYVQKYFADNPGIFGKEFQYPSTFRESKNWFKQFLSQRFYDFGAYEDAIVSEEYFLNHSLLSPLLNSGLITPQTVIEESLDFSSKNNIPINSIEGFIRQIIGWREFIRGLYQYKGTEQRTKNFWNFTNKIPSSFYDATTGIDPLDSTIKKVLRTGYCHHIERLMILGNFMLLCEFNPDEVYKWFMELFIDAYDWVMVPNVYGMSQFADAGLMATKPYISGSNYLLKMSNFKKGEWTKIWDALFWRFMHVHRDFFLQNPRLGMLVKTYDKMAAEKQDFHIKTAENYIKNFT